jgi:dTMP kinase
VSERGAFVVLEGGEGSGKSTQAQILARRLRSDGRDVVETFEPGGTARGALLRSVLLDDETPLDPRAELLLMAADRAQHVAELIEPAVARGAIVVCDRFSPSTLVYQGLARGLGIEVVESVDRFAAQGVAPDVVVVLDVSDAVALQRLPEASDRFERAGAAFHSAVRGGYRDLAGQRGWIVIDGEGAPDAVAAAVWSAVAPLLTPQPPPPASGQAG